MVRFDLTGFSLLILIVLGMTSSALFAQSLVYEREFTMISEEDNTIRMELTADGKLVIDRPVFMTNSGRHELSVGSFYYTQLYDQLAARSADSGDLSMEVQRQANQDMRYISDPEISRFYRLDEQGRKIDFVSAVSLEAWTRVYPNDQRLASLRHFEQQWYQLMQMAVSAEDAQ